MAGGVNMEKIWYNPKYNVIFLIWDYGLTVPSLELGLLTQANIDEMMKIKGRGEAWLKRCGFVKIGEYKN